MPAASEANLELRGLTVHRQVGTTELPVLRDIDLDVAAGQWLAVLGSNGSGKSTLLRYLASAESPWADGAAIMFQDPDDQLAAATVEQELALCRHDAEARALAEIFGLTDLLPLDPRLLSAGQKQRLVLAVALAAEPDLLLCDEPVALQDEAQAVWLLDRLDRWRGEPGRRLITATQDIREAERADRLLVLEAGRIVCTGPTADLLADERVRALLSNDLQPQSPRHDAASAGDAAPLLVLEDVGCTFGARPGFAGVDLRLRAGDRLGITGPNGCGKSTLLALCCGARRPSSGRLTLLGRALYRHRALDLDHGAALLAPQFPEYLFTRSTVAAEIAVDPATAALGGADVLAAARLSPDLLERHPHSLSSGQRRRLALALVLLSERPVLLLDEPGAALDRPGRQAVVDLLATVPAGSAVVIASHDRALLEAAGCRIRILGARGLSHP